MTRMPKMKSLFVVMVTTAALTVAPSALAAGACPNGAVGAPCVHYVAAGTAVTFQQFALAVVNDVARLLQDSVVPQAERSTSRSVELTAYGCKPVRQIASWDLPLLT
jgi:hypothetical protein